MMREIRVCPRPLLPVNRLLLGFLLLLAVAYPASATTPRELLDAGRVDEAMRLLAPQATGNNAAALNYLGRAYFSLEDWDNAVRYCERAAQIEPRNATFQLWLGRSYGEKANASSILVAYPLARKTVTSFISARTLDRQSLDIARDLAEYFFTAPPIVGGGKGKALALAAELAPAHPSDAAWVRAKVATNAGEYEKAEREYNEAIRLDHNSATAYLELARYLRDRKSWERFHQVIERAIKSTHIRPTDYYDTAELLLGTNRDLPLAAQQMRTYIQSGHTAETAPAFRAHFLLGQILLKSGATSEAIAEYQAALALANSYRPAAEALQRLRQR